MNCLWSCVLLMGVVMVMADDPCRGVSCSTARCVDGVMDADGCCKICPNGANCWVDGVIVVDRYIIQYQDPECERHCHCPSGFVYELDGDATQAGCAVFCNGNLVPEGK